MDLFLKRVGMGDLFHVNHVVSDPKGDLVDPENNGNTSEHDLQRW